MRKVFICLLLLIFYEVGADPFKNKADLLLYQVSETYKHPNINITDPGKYCFPYAIARFSVHGYQDSIANKLLFRLKNKDAFHFTVIGLVRLVYLFPNAASFTAFKSTFLDSVWYRKDSYNCWTGEGSENHLNMSKTSGYLIAQMALRENLYPDAAMRLHISKKWIEEWAKDIFYKGTGEWNSSTYGVFNIIGWLNLYDFSTDPEIRGIAKAVLDYYGLELAIHYDGGITAGGEMRGGAEVEPFESGTDYLAWFWFGNEKMALEDHFWKGSNYIYSVHAATSQYKPNTLIEQLALKKSELEIQGFKAHYSRLPANTLVESFYKNEDFSFGLVNTNYSAMSNGTKQLVSWKMISTNKADSLKPFVLTGNGSYYQTDQKCNGVSKDPFTQNALYKDSSALVFVQITKMPIEIDKITSENNKRIARWKTKWKADFKKRFPTDVKKHNPVGVEETNKQGANQSWISVNKSADFLLYQNVLFVQLGSVYMGCRHLTKDKNIIVQKSPNKRLVFKDSAALGQCVGFVVEIHPSKNFKSFDAFVDFFLEQTSFNINNEKLMYITSFGHSKAFDLNALEVKYEDLTKLTDPIIDWAYGFLNPDYRNFKSNIIMKHAGLELKETPNQNPIYFNPQVYVGNGIFSIQDHSKCYEINYTQGKPIFYESF